MKMVVYSCLIMEIYNLFEKLKDNFVAIEETIADILLCGSTKRIDSTYKWKMTLKITFLPLRSTFLTGYIPYCRFVE